MKSICSLLRRAATARAGAARALLALAFLLPVPALAAYGPGGPSHRGGDDIGTLPTGSGSGVDLVLLGGYEDLRGALLNVEGAGAVLVEPFLADDGEILFWQATVSGAVALQLDATALQTGRLKALLVHGPQFAGATAVVQVGSSELTPFVLDRQGVQELPLQAFASSDLSGLAVELLSPTGTLYRLDVLERADGGFSVTQNFR